ncbi:hypothetical protein Pcinc_040761 [Petrolisthes cinctipes]|uniref:Uncharacterized protein n=1 Tax=Petrolisthes cinctipes TaxID=88211 RepID=A0AAE1BKU9_PETCI|nr:hypothetical protein Pcinc_040761 [Petrolisthes cinctipes]
MVIEVVVIEVMVIEVVVIVELLMVVMVVIGCDCVNGVMVIGGDDTSITSTPYNAYTEHPRPTPPQKAPRLGYKAKLGLVIYDRKHPVTKAYTNDKPKSHGVHSTVVLVC